MAIISQGALNASQIVAAGLYVQILPPPSAVGGVPSNIGAISGSAAWGPVGQPVLTGGPPDVLRNFGPIPSPNAFGSGVGTTLDATQNPYDLVQEALATYTQAQNGATFGLWLLRAVDGTNYVQGGSPGTGGSGQNTTGAYASLQLADYLATSGLLLYGLYLGTLGNGVTVTIANGNKGSTVATLFTASTTSPDGILWTSVLPGAEGNNVSIHIVISGGGSTATVSVTGQAITITAGSTCTNATVVSDVAATPTAAALVTGVATGGTDDVVAVAATNLAGGTSYATVTVNPPAGLGMNQEVYPNIPLVGSYASPTAAQLAALGPYVNYTGYKSLFWPNLAAAILNGVANVRGPSVLLYAPQVGTVISGQSAPSTTALQPALITNTALAGGIDGSTFITAGYAGTNNLQLNMIGSNAAYPFTGLYMLGSLNPPVSHFRLAGFGENSADVTNAGAIVKSIADSIGAIFWCGFPIGDDSSTTTAVTAVQNSGIDDFEWVNVKDHAYWADGVHAPRFVPMSPFAMGVDLSLPPQNAPLNTAVQGIIGTYRSVSQGAMAPYSLTEIGACQNGRIALIATPCPGGVYVGFNTDVNSSSNPVTSPIEYGTLTNNIVKALAQSFGKYVGGANLQSPVNPQDPVRQGVQDELNNYLARLTKANVIAAGFAQCDLNNNTAATVAAHFLFAFAQATYLASVWYFLLSFTGGTTVQVQVRQGAAA